MQGVQHNAIIQLGNSSKSESFNYTLKLTEKKNIHWVLFLNVFICKCTVQVFHSFPQTIFNTKKRALTLLNNTNDTLIAVLVNPRRHLSSRELLPVAGILAYSSMQIIPNTFYSPKF